MFYGLDGDAALALQLGCPPPFFRPIKNIIFLPANFLCWSLIGSINLVAWRVRDVAVSRSVILTLIYQFIKIH